MIASAVQADSVSVIQLKYRPAVEVIPIIEPMLGADDAISGEGFRLFVRASAESQERVRSMVEFLDTAARELQISVFQGSQQVLRGVAARANARFESGNTGIEVGGGRDVDDGAGGRITYSTAEGRVGVQGIATQRSLRDSPIHSVRVTEGNDAYIETGQRIPYFSGAAWRGRRALAGAVEYETVVTGFYVLPRLRGDNVVLDVSPFKSSRSDTGRGNIDTQSASTTVSGRVGEWILIGGVAEQIEQAESATGSAYATRGSRNTGIWIKAELVE